MPSSGVTASAMAARVRGVLFDLDGTLYSNANGYRKHVIGRLFSFMHEHLGIPRSTPAESIWRPLFDKYHQSERGFREEGYARAYLRINGVWRDHLLFAMLAADWRTG